MVPPSWPPRAVGVEASYLPGALLLPQITPKAPRPLLCESREGKSPASFLLLPTAPVPHCATLSKLLTPANLSGFICEMEPVHFASQPWEAPHEKHKTSLQLWTP